MANSIAERYFEESTNTWFTPYKKGDRTPIQILPSSAIRFSEADDATLLKQKAETEISGLLANEWTIVSSPDSGFAHTEQAGNGCLLDHHRDLSLIPGLSLPLAGLREAMAAVTRPQPSASPST